MMKEDKKTPHIEIDPDVLEEAASAVKTDNFDPGVEAQQTDEPQQSDTATNRAPAQETEMDYKDRFIRLSADFDNYRKRTLKEKSDYIKYGNESLLREVLPILDNFERALSSSSESDAASIIQGVEMILAQLTQSLEKYGLQSTPTEGQRFDPNLHEAMDNVEDDSVEPGTITQEHQKLYRYHEKLLRPALVTVSQSPKKDR